MRGWLVHACSCDWRARISRKRATQTKRTTWTSGRPPPPLPARDHAQVNPYLYCCGWPPLPRIRMEVGEHRCCKPCQPIGIHPLHVFEPIFPVVLATCPFMTGLAAWPARRASQSQPALPHLPNTCPLFSHPLLSHPPLLDTPICASPPVRAHIRVPPPPLPPLLSPHRLFLSNPPPLPSDEFTPQPFTYPL